MLSLHCNRCDMLSTFVRSTLICLTLDERSWLAIFNSRIHLHKSAKAEPCDSKYLADVDNCV